jgi:hypothetical protein
MSTYGDKHQLNHIYKGLILTHAMAPVHSVNSGAHYWLPDKEKKKSNEKATSEDAL